MEKQLKDWAVPGADLGAANKRKQAEVLHIWQLTLSVGLLRGRVGVGCARRCAKFVVQRSFQVADGACTRCISIQLPGSSLPVLSGRRGVAGVEIFNRGWSIAVLTLL